MKKLIKKISRKSIMYSVLLRAAVDKKFAIKYYTSKYRNELPSLGTGVIFKGRMFLSDSREIVIGKNTTIGANCRIRNIGGVYIGDNCCLGENLLLDTNDQQRISSDNFGKRKVDAIIIGKNAVIKSNVRVDAGVIIPDNAVIEEKEHVSKNYSFTIKEDRSLSDSGSKNAVSMGGNLFFLASTGRSGTTAFTRILSDHPAVEFIHERFFLNRLSTEFAHKIKSFEKVLKELEVAYIKSSLIPSHVRIFGESDQKNTNLIKLYHQLLPKAKFIWLLRRADDFVASAHGRGWFDDREYVNNPDSLSKDNITGKEFFEFYRLEYSQYRINGHLVGEFTKEQWSEMSSFERCCWYWHYWNSLIEDQLSELTDDQWMIIRLEEINNQMENIFQFLQVDTTDLTVKKHNKAYHKTYPRKKWNKEQTENYEKWCRKGMSKWYNEKAGTDV